MIDFNPNTIQDIEQEQVMDFRELILKAKKFWLVFIACGFLGIIIGFILTKMTKNEFELSTTLLITEKNNQLNADFLFESMGINSKTNAQDQIGILSSYMINMETIEQLDWKATWYERDLFKTLDLYKHSPFEVTKIEGDSNLLGIKVFITPINDLEYEVTVDDEYKIGGKTFNIQMDSKGTFGEIFNSTHFNFIIQKNETSGELLDKDYFFVFNDLVDLTNKYRENISLGLADEKSNLINLKLIDSNPERAVDYLNKLSKVFIQFGLKEKNLASENTVKFIDSQLLGIVDSLQQAGKNFTNFRTENRILDLSQEAGLIMERLREVETSQSMATMKLDYYNNLLQYLGDAKKMEQMVAPSVVGITDQSLNAMVLSLGELYSKRNALAITVQEKNPSLIAIDNEIAYTQQSLQENLKNLISNARVEIRNLAQNKNKINQQLSKLPKTEQNMVNIKRSFDLNNELYTFLLQKRAEAAIAKASTTPDVKALDIARLENAVPVGTNKLFNLFLGLLTGLLVPTVLLVILNYLDNKINKKEDISRLSLLPLIGNIAHNKLHTEYPVIKSPESGVTETFRSLRTNLQYLLDSKTSNVIAIQSMISGEGKSFIALNLAMAFAINNRKVLLVDGDLRKPQLHISFNIKNETGLSTFLMNKSQFKDIIKESRIKNLSFVTTGPILRNTAELVDSEQFVDFMQKVREEFDYIIINNSPISIVTDGMIIGANADSNLIVLRQNYSLKDQLKSINDIAKQGFLKKISLVFNDVNMDSQGYYFGNGNGYFSDTNSKNKPRWKYKPSKETIT